MAQIAVTATAPLSLAHRRMRRPAAARRPAAGPAGPRRRVARPLETWPPMAGWPVGWPTVGRQRGGGRHQPFDLDVRNTAAVDVGGLARRRAPRMMAGSATGVPRTREEPSRPHSRGPEHPPGGVRGRRGARPGRPPGPGAGCAAARSRRRRWPRSGTGHPRRPPGPARTGPRPAPPARATGPARTAARSAAVSKPR